ncbi:MAG TPA: hypothetical protein VF173_01405 [Thermoanaerobaculia bacterium]|nr:hypothetical protein [Thermoanaerobaculia bacterium]
MKKTRAFLLACACLLIAAAATRPAKSDSCQFFHMCEPCSNHQGTHLCTITVCGMTTSVSCLACSGECILPGS